MTHLPISRSLFAACLLAPALALAQVQVYQAPFLGSTEDPPVTTPGTGLGTVTIDRGLNTMRVEISFEGLLGATTVAHLHCCTANPLAGNSAPATQVPSFTGFPTGVTAGTYDRTFDMTATASYNPAFVTANGGSTANAFAALIAGLDTGRSYLNLHSSAFPTGEVRAILTPIPEPSAALTLLVGLGLAGLMTRRGVARRSA